MALTISLYANKLPSLYPALLSSKPLLTFPLRCLTDITNLICLMPGPQLPLAPNLLLLKFSLIQEKAAPIFPAAQVKPSDCLLHSTSSLPTNYLDSTFKMFLESNASHSTATTWSTAFIPHCSPCFCLYPLHSQHSSQSDPVQTLGPL